MSEIKLNLTSEAVNYTNSVDKLKQAAKQHADAKGVVTISYKEGSEEEKKIEAYASQIGKLFAKGKDLDKALRDNPLLQKKLAALLKCGTEELPKILSDLNKSVRDFPKVLGGILAVSEDAVFQKTTERMLSAAAPFMNAVTDRDMRELLKLLIMAFAQLMTSQRESDLYNLNNMMQAFAAKLTEMGKAKDEQYKAAWNAAITGMIFGIVTLGVTIAGTYMQGASATNTMKENAVIERAAKEAGDKLVNGQLKMVSEQSLYQWGGALMAGGKASSDIFNNLASIFSAGHSQKKAEADIRATAQDQLAEVLRKAQEQNQSTTRALLDYMNNLISMMQQLIQSARQTEMGIVQA